MSEQRAPILLKKYGNRRLYDARRSGYVTLVEVEEMLQRNDDVQVVDAKTGEDLTSQVLVQIILDRPGARQALPTAFLKQVVRLKDSPLKETFSRGLTQLVDAFADAQKGAVQAGREQIRQVASPQQNPFLAMALNPFSVFAPPAPARPAGPDTRDREIELLREQLDETRSLVQALAAQRAPAAIEAPAETGPAPAKRKRKASGR